MKNKYRLTATVYDRETDEDKIPPLKIYFLSVEGNLTEKEYFESISQNRSVLGINTKIDVKVLKRGKQDTNSAPDDVVDLLEEYLSLRECGTEDIADELPKKIIDDYGEEFIKEYLKSPENITSDKKKCFLIDLRKLGYDLEYRKYLSQYDNDYDQFGIVIDRDAKTHTSEMMEECINYCDKKGYNCYISNPCFEFWLLLHLSNVNEEFKEKLHLIKENAKVSDKHTYVSKIVSEKAGHGKRNINFESNYLDKINTAIERAKSFETDNKGLINNIGSNVFKLIEDMRGGV